MLNQRLMASAGTGKTYALTNRYIRILLLQPEPQHILAMTFTRKAAGEFFQKTLVKLQKAASTPEESASLSRDLEVDATQEDYLRLLRLLIDHMSQLQLSTFDSFFGFLVRCFPLELGLSGKLDILSPEEERTREQRILLTLLDQNTLSEQELGNLAQIIAEATAGRESASILSQLLDLVHNTLPIFLKTPNVDNWGAIDPIQDQNGEHAEFPESEWDKLLQQTSELAATEQFRKAMNQALQIIRTLYISGKLERTNTLSQRILNSVSQLHSENFEINYNKRTYTLPLAYREALHRAVQAALTKTLQRIRARTRAHADLLKLYFSRYQEECFRTGRFSFSDTLQLLTPDSHFNLNPSSQRSISNHEWMHYRLDARFDHWLLDEFQDTSREQWHTIQPLVDEIIQDNEGRRSFFYVGDVKQCLYQWRGSDSHLFDEIFRRYQERIENGTPLNVSWRSRPEILNMVNQVFGDKNILIRETSNKVADRWMQFWNNHVSAPPLAEKGKAHATLLAYDKDEDDAFHKEVLRLLHEIDPVNRGLSVAILLRKNKHIKACADYLRLHTDLPVTIESNLSPFEDNVAGVLLRQWVMYALHPQDTAARGMLQLYHGNLSQEEWQQWLSRVRRLLFDRGLGETVLALTPLILNATGKDNAFLQFRLEQCLTAARSFDLQMNADPESFLEFAENYKVADNSSTNSVQVLTIHKSKGLDYDIVIMDTPSSKFLEEPDAKVIVGESHASRNRWVLEKPIKDICDCIPEIREARDQLILDQAFEKLCVLYVGMTRARSGLYVFTPYPIPSPDDMRNAPTLFCAALRPETSDQTPVDIQIGNETFRSIYSDGNPCWFKQHNLRPQVVETKLPLQSAVPSPSPRLARFLPSQQDTQKKKGEWFLSTRNTLARELGTHVHAFFEQIEWLPEDATQWQAILRPLNPGLSDELFSHILELLNQSDWRSFFVRSNDSATLWREKPFSVIINQQWMNGVFDRVILHYDSRGKIHSADLLDFKTDRVENDEETRKKIDHHRPQLLVYKQALSILLNLGTADVHTHLAFITNGQIHEVTE